LPPRGRMGVWEGIGRGIPVGCAFATFSPNGAPCQRCGAGAAAK
jgi:hypothetical protein